jgi:hypothetical protein
MPLPQDAPAMLDANDRRFLFSHAKEEKAPSSDRVGLALDRLNACGGTPDAD